MKKKGCGCNHKVKVDIPTKPNKVSTPNRSLQVRKGNPFAGGYS